VKVDRLNGSDLRLTVLHHLRLNPVGDDLTVVLPDVEDPTPTERFVRKMREIDDAH
jgi:hypothetical protein